MKENKFIIGSFTGIILTVLLLYPVNFILDGLNIIDITKYSTGKANLKTSGFLYKLNNKVESIKTSIENKSIDYFPFYSSINFLVKNTETKSNKFLYNILDIEYYPVGINHDGEYIFSNSEHFVLGNNLSTSELNMRFDKQIDFFNNLDIDNLHIFIPYRYEYIFDNNYLPSRDMNSYIDKFKSELNDNISISEYKVNSYSEYISDFYKSDHHYNMKGAYKAYKIIMDDLGYAAKDGKIIENDINYYGSMAKSTFSTSIKDKFYTLDIELEDHDILVDNKINNNYKPKIILDSKGTFYDYYVSYYNGLFSEVLYDFHDNSKKNLLILEDSYGWQIDELIASSYNKTYVIDIRQGKYKNEEFNINKFIKDNDID